ncbi:hypothetical protein IIY24_00780, partial [Candidatus Saccharibacteria bacterium]|nr:hypothetical protein [Candidatus Saccharibacteria bacterium]
IEISHDGLNSKELSINLENEHALTVSTFLTDGSGEFYELKENYDSFQKLSEIASAGNNKTFDQDTSLEKFIARMNDILSISEILPIKGYVYDDTNVGASTAGFTIQLGNNKLECKKITCLLVKYYGSNYEEAVTEEIVKAGYDPANYQIFYERYN